MLLQQHRRHHLRGGLGGQGPHRHIEGRAAVHAAGGRAGQRHSTSLSQQTGHRGLLDGGRGASGPWPRRTEKSNVSGECGLRPLDPGFVCVDARRGSGELSKGAVDANNVEKLP